MNQPQPNPKRVAAGKLNGIKRGELSAEGRERLRQCAHATRPWEHASGPRTAEGKARSARNGRLRRREHVQSQEIRSLLAELGKLTGEMAATRRLVQELQLSTSSTGIA
jgi:hypothetical protein